MDENHQDKTESKLIATENKSQLPPFSPEDEKEAQKELDRLRKRLRENENGAVKVNHKLNRKRTGFEDKTFWDWLNLLGVLAIPLVVVGATIAFGFLQIHLADLQHQNDLKIAQKQHDSDQQIALDQQQEATLEAYLNDMTTLLLDKKLGSQAVADKVVSADAAVVARAKTLTALRRLTDPVRKAIVVQFLYEAHLIGGFPYNPVPPPYLVAPAVIDLSGANLSGAILSDAVLDGANLSGAGLKGAILSDAHLPFANLSGADLSGADLSGAFLTDAHLGANLSGANLSRASLNGADLSGAFLRDANLNGAFLRDANLNGADLDGATLRDANLTNANLAIADLTNANLTNANLTNALLTQQQLDQVYSCKGAILPPDLTCHRTP